jgi:hypothetical protein
MRLFSCLIAISLLVILPLGCLTVSPDECWPNTSGGLGGSKPIPIGAGVGATSGGDSDGPSGGTPNPCTATESPPPKGNTGGATCPAAGSDAGDTYQFCPDACPQGGACVAGVISMFRPSNFSFVTVLADKGGIGPGGWQEARAVLAFADGLFEITTCQVRIGMPLRTQTLGLISSSTAAIYSAGAANGAASSLWPTDLPPGIFCSKLKPAIQQRFNEQYPGLGAAMMDL